MRAQAKWVRMSARKGRVVAEHIRGRSVPEARAVLAFTQRAAAREIEKVLASAVANAEANHGLVGDELVVYTAVVDEGPTLKRWRARARGRVARIKKRTCHITRHARAAAPRSRSPPPSRSRRRPSRSRPKRRDRADGRRRAEEKPKRAGEAEGRTPKTPSRSREQPRKPRRKKTRGELMGQKIHPGGLRVGVIHDWKSNWYTSAKEFKGALLEDIKIREHINRSSVTRACPTS